MTPERLKQADELAEAALKRSPDQRARFLREACAGDEELRRVTESLLDYDSRAGSFLEEPAFKLTAALIDADRPESLAGRRIGHYEIISKIGSGGMGDVYLARDTSLDRRVALKLLPADFMTDPERVRRFTQEAKAASALDHPNVCTIHQVGQSSNFLYIAMQYIEGVTLKQLIASRPLKLDALLSISLQAADALAAAHDLSIIHRDIKSDNIIVTPKGQAKVLDFGLAKRTSSCARADVNGTETELTKTGVVMGTPSYMSPEQAQGEHVDHRSDIFSLGVVIYEMATGEVPFKKKSQAETMNAVIKEPHTPVTEVNEEIPAELSEVIDRALSKDPAGRYQSIGEMLSGLRQVGRAVGLLGPSDSDAAVIPYVPLGRRSASRWMWAALIVVLACGGLLTLRLFNPRLRHSIPNSYRDWEIVRLTRTGGAVFPAISRDGKYVAYVNKERGQESVWVLQLATSARQQIVAPRKFKYFNLLFTLDTSELYFTRREGPSPLRSLYRIPLLGGVAKKLRDEIDSPVLLSPDGAHLAFARRNGQGKSEFVIADAEGAEERVLVGHGLQFPDWSPDGKVIAFSAGNAGTGGEDMGIHEIRLEDGAKRELSPRKWNHVGNKSWLPDGSGLIVCAREQKSNVTRLWSVAYPSGDARPLSNEFDDFLSVGLTADGRMLVTQQVTSVSDIWVGPLADVASAKKIGVWGRSGLCILPDGRIVYSSLQSGEAIKIWIINADGTGEKQLTIDSGNDLTPATSPDGRYIVFASNRSGNFEIWRMNLDGSNLIQLTRSKGTNSPCISPDASWVIYLSSGDGNLYKVPIEGGEPQRVAGKAVGVSAMSPNGKLIAYFAQGKEAWQIAVSSFEDGSEIKRFGTGSLLLNNSALKWTPDGRALLYAAVSDGVGNIWMQSLDGSTPKQVTDFKADGIFRFDVSSDGKDLVCARGGWRHDVVLISNLNR